MSETFSPFLPEPFVPSIIFSLLSLGVEEEIRLVSLCFMPEIFYKVSLVILNCVRPVFPRLEFLLTTLVELILDLGRRFPLLL